MLGAKDLPLTITGNILHKVTKKKHSIDLSELEKLPSALNRPLAVFESVTQANSMVVLTELMEGNNNVVVAVHLNVSGGRVVVNQVASLYGKNSPRALWGQPCLYLDKYKAQAWLTTNRLQLPSVVPPKHERKRKILTPKDLVKWEEENNLPNVTFSSVMPRRLPAFMREMEEIKVAAQKDGTWLKAPNGKESNLPEDLWCAVRTATFKGWFGDWETYARN